MPVSDSKRKRLQELRALRIKGQTRGSTYELEDDTAIYDELDNEEFRKHQQQRLREDDFVVDDNGEGYMDTGAYDWEDGAHNYYSDDDEESARHSRKKKKADQSKKRTDADVTAMFKRVSAIQEKPAIKATEEDKQFFDDLLDNLDGPRNSTVKSDKKLKLGPKVKVRAVEVFNTTSIQVPSSPPVGIGAEDITSLPMEPSSPTPARQDTPATQDVAMSDIEDAEDDLGIQVLKPSAIANTNVNISSVKPVPKILAAPSLPSSDIGSENNGPEADELPSMSLADLGSIEATDEQSLVEDAVTGAIASDVKSFFWTDYHEANEELILFGKAKIQEAGKKERIVSASIVIKGICREVYFLPRENQRDNPDEPVQIKELYDEVTEWIERQSRLSNNARLRNFRAKPTDRKYCFDLKGVPKEAKYLKVLIPYTRLPERVPSSGNTYSQVFGSQTSMFEQFVVSRKVKGPCWFDVEQPVIRVSKATRVALELEVSDPFTITPMNEQGNTPPLNIMSVSIRTFMNRHTDKQEVVALSVSVYKNTHIDPSDQDEHPIIQVYTIVRPLREDFSLQYKDALKKQREFANMSGHLQGSVIIKPNETELLREFLERIGETDPDIILGHQLEAVHLPVIVHRIKELKALHKWDQLGRLKRKNWPNFNSASVFSLKQLFCGRLLCDLYNTMGQSLTTACDSWTLTEMCSLYLDNLKRPDWDIDISKYDARDRAEGFVRFLKHNENDTHYTMRLALAIQILPLTKQLTEIAGNSWAGTLSGSRAQRNEFILLHEFTREGYIVPDKAGYGSQHQQKQARKEQQQQQEEGEVLPSKSKYQGGKVLDPISGLYRSLVLVLDFNSLYPSIIREFNICFTTIDYSKYNDSENDEFPELPDSSVKQGIFPRLIETLVETRKYVKAEMKKVTDPKLKKRFDIKQQALKLTANSMYGCLGFEHSRFYALPLAMTITQKGRDILTNTCKLAENNFLQVIYGDTDSVMINTKVNWDSVAVESRSAELLATLAKNNIGNHLPSQKKLELVQNIAKAKELQAAFDKAVKIGTDFKTIVNEQYKSLELDIDNVFKTFLINSKKKYAAVDLAVRPYASNSTKIQEIDAFVNEAVKVGGVQSELVEKQVIKGLDLVRREFCDLTKQASRYALDQILSDEPVESAVENIHEYLRKLSDDLRNDRAKPHQYLMRRKLNKAPEDYTGSSRDQPQVQVALRRKADGELVGKDDVIGYIITTGKEGDTSSAAPKRAFSLAEFKKYDLKPDVDYYLQMQILPPLERICHNIDGIDKGTIAECMGLKIHASRYFGDSSASGQNAYVPLDYTISDEERFARAEPFYITCKNGHKYEFKGLSKTAYDTVSNDGITCPECKELVSHTRVNAQLECAIRHEIGRYYNGWLTCSECSMRTRQISVYGRRCLRKDDNTRCSGIMSYEYSSKMMHYQLQYFNSLFDVERAKKNADRSLSLQEEALHNKADLLQSHEVNTRAEHNRPRFTKTQSVVDKYVADCGRAFVDMRDIFGTVQL